MVLLIENDDQARARLEHYMSGQGYQVVAAATGDAAMTTLAHTTFSVALVDLQQPDSDGIELIRRICTAAPDTVVLVMAEAEGLETVLEVFRSGAHDYLLKPVGLEALGSRIAGAVRYRRLLSAAGRLRRGLQPVPGRWLIGRSAAIAEINRLIGRVAPAHSTVLITGESGTGKELVARALHQLSGRGAAGGVFVPVNMAAVPEGLLESHLFGHVRGAFTGAGQARAGAFRLAAGGTLFLDEIGELPLELQPKLLRALEERAVWPVGSDTPVAAAPRVVAATNHDLGEQVRAGRFREDLWYRLNVVNIHIPPLRERLEDIPVLVEYLLGRYREELGRPVLGVEREAMRALLGHGWRGNVRELANVLERAVLLGDGPLLRLADLPAETLAVISSAATSAGASERLH